MTAATRLSNWQPGSAVVVRSSAEAWAAIMRMVAERWGQTDPDAIAIGTHEVRHSGTDRMGRVMVAHPRIGPVDRETILLAYWGDPLPAS